MSYFLTASLEMLKFYTIFRYWCRMPLREKKDISIISAVVLWIIYSCICSHLGQENLIFYVIWALLELIVSFKYHIGKLVVLGIGAMGLIGTLDGLSGMGIELVCAMFKINIERQLANILAGIITYIFLMMLYEYILKDGDISISNIGIMNLLYIFIIGFLYPLILALILDEVFGENSKSVSMKVFIIFFLLITSVFYQIIILLKLAVSNKKLEKKDATNQHYIELQEKQYTYLKETEQETKRFRHDMRQHIFSISQLCKEGNMAETKKYITKTWGELEHLSGGACINNSIADAILNQYSSLCEKAGIRFHVKGYLPTDCKIESYDICTLFSNILQNAYEAALQCESKIINLAIRYDEKNIYIKQSNTYNGMILEKNGKIMTNKDDKLVHGFGLENIDKCTRKYGGSFGLEKIDKEERLVNIQIILQNKCPKKRGI